MKYIIIGKGSAIRYLVEFLNIIIVIIIQLFFYLCSPQSFTHMIHIQCTNCKTTKKYIIL